MPFIEEPLPLPAPRLPLGDLAEPPERPDAGRTMGAAFSLASPVGSALAAVRGQEHPFEDEAGYTPFPDIKGTQYERDYADSFVASRSRAETEAIKAQIDRERENEQVLGASGTFGVVAALGMGLVDPTIILPGGALVRTVRGGVNVARSAASVGAAGAVQGLASEAILQGTQHGRTSADLLESVATSTMLSGLLGGGAAALLGKAERVALERALDADRTLIGRFDAPADPSAGAAAADTRVATPQGYLLDRVPGVSRALEAMSPVNRGLNRGLVSARRGMADLAESALATADNLEGRTTARFGMPAEREIKMAQRQTVIAFDDVIDDAWKRFRFGEEGAPRFARARSVLESITNAEPKEGSFAWFDAEVGKAMRRGDQHEIPEVAEVAKWVRENVFKPWVARAQALPEGHPMRLPENVDVKTAESYFTRTYNTEKIRSRMSDFVERTTAWLEEEQTRKFAAQQRIDALDADRRVVKAEAAKIEAQLARSEEQLKALEARAREREMEASRAGARVETLEERFGDQAAELSELAEAVQAFKAQAAAPELRDRIATLEREVAALRREEGASRMTPADLARREEGELQARFLATEDQKTFADLVVRQRAESKEPSLFEFVRKKGGTKASPIPGGVNDTGGDLRAALGGKPPPGLINSAGMSLDQWGEYLWSNFGRGFHGLRERPSPDEVLDWIVASTSGQQPRWFIESVLTVDELNLIDAKRVAFETRAEMLSLGYTPRTRLDVARFLADHSEPVPAGPRIDDPGIPPPMRLEAGEARVGELQDVVEEARGAVAWARAREAAVDRAAGNTRIRQSEAGITARASEQRGEELARQAAVAERKRALQEEALAIVKEHEARVFDEIEAELRGWGGKSAGDALTALRARDKAGEGRDPAAPRLTAADADVLTATRKILESDREHSRMELQERARQIADRIISSPDGRQPYDETPAGGGGFSRGRDAARGALARREFMIPDERIEDFLEDSTGLAVRKFMHTTAPDLVLSERFGDFNLSEVVRKIQDEAQQLAAGADEAKAREIFADRDAAIRDIAAVRDRIRGTFVLAGVSGTRNAARVGSAVRSYNMLTDLGGAALSSIPDIAGAVFRWGFGTVLRDAYVPFLRGLVGSSDGYARAKEQYRAMGVASEMALATRSRAVNDISPFYRPETRLERTLQAGGELSQVVNLQAGWTDFTKTLAAVTSGNEIFRATKAVTEGTATPKQIADLAASGIDSYMARKIWAEFSRPGAGEVVDGVHLPNTDTWRDVRARAAFEAAVGREADIVVVTPGQEKPLWMSDPLLGLIGQHKSFIVAATERILLANLQRRDAATLSGLITAISAGMMSAALYSITTGKDFPERPQDWVKEGINRSGVLGWFEEANAITAKATRGGLDAYRIIGADKPLSKFTNRTILSQIGGPTAGKIEQFAGVAGAPFGDEGWSARDTAKIRQMIPLQNLFFLRRGLNEVEDATNRALGIEPLEKR